MTWEILAASIVIITCLISVGTVLARLVRAITKLEVTLSSIEKSIAEDKLTNCSEHKEFRCDIKNHEVRITSIENRREG